MIALDLFNADDLVVLPRGEDGGLFRVFGEVLHEGLGDMDQLCGVRGKATPSEETITKAPPFI